MRARFAGVVTVCGAVLLVSCVPSEPAPSAPTDDAVQVPASPQGLTQRGARARGSVTPEEYLAHNPKAWVGRAHNSFLRIFLSELRKAKGKNACAILQRVLLDGAFLGADSLKFPREERERSGRAMLAKNECSAETALRATWNRRNQVLGSTRFASSRVSSGDPSPYLSAIEATPDQASSVGDLSSMVSWITSDAEANLTGAELDQVYAVGSIAVSSAEYWEASAVAEAEAMYPAISDCLHTAQDPNTCVYDASPWRRRTESAPTLLRLAVWRSSAGDSDLGLGTAARLANLRTQRRVDAGFAVAKLRFARGNAPTPDCTDVLGWRGIARSDITWGIAGALGGPQAALAAGTFGSARSFLWRGVAYLVCVYAS